MFTFFTRLATIITLFSSFGLSAAPGYISDDVYVYLHSGPGTNYRILGSIIAGTPIEILKASDDGQFNQIKDDKERIGWVKAALTSTSPSVRVNYSKLQQQLAQLQQKTMSASDELTQANNKINKLEQSLKAANGKLLQAQDSERIALAQLKGEDEQIKMQWAMNGGMLVGISILLGVALTYLPKKKKKSGNWS